MNEIRGLLETQLRAAGDSQAPNMYGTVVSPTLISSVTDVVIEEAKAWQPMTDARGWERAAT